MISDEKFNESLLKKIKDDKIKPLPKWRFSVRNILIWSVGALSLIFGALSVSLIIYMQQISDLPMYQQMNTDALDLVALIFPLFWFILLAVFVTAIYFNVKKTQRGYRYRPPYIILVSLCLSIVFGFLFHLAGADAMIDDWLALRAPYYDRVMSPHLHYWSDPEHGRLIGLASSDMIDSNFTLMSPDQGEWQVVFEADRDDVPLVIRQGAPVRCLGQKVAEQKFVARRILPVMLGKKFFNRPGAGCAMGRMKPGACAQVKSFNASPLRDLIAESLLANKEQVKAIIKNDPRAMMEINALQLDKDIVRQILQ